MARGICSAKDMSRNLAVIASVVGLILSPNSVGQTAERRVPVQVVASGEGVLSTRFAFELREAIRGSQAMRLDAIGALLSDWD
jgi:hypothetical protein